jgi:hypothetical protein
MTSAETVVANSTPVTAFANVTSITMVQQISCHGDSDGQITTDASGGKWFFNNFSIDGGISFADDIKYF